jgi:ribosomal protein S18 acetylase RimI-like enzyme
MKKSAVTPKRVEEVKVPSNSNREVVAIREARPQECFRILELWKLVGSVSSVTDTTEYLQELVTRNGDLFLVAEVSGRIVGTVFGGWDFWRAHLYRLAVDPECRGRGIARALVEEIERRLRNKGARRIYALTYTEEGLAFWGSSDYERTTDTAFVRTYRD